MSLRSSSGCSGWRAPSASVALGIGDDCAIYRPRAGEELLFTTDQMIEGVHFTRAQSAASIGESALARSLSDIAAMGGEPRFCLVALAAADTRWIEDFYRGLLRLAKRTGTTLAGGDLARDEKIHCDVMVCGSAPRGKALRRDGARVGDSIYVSGRLGKTWERAHSAAAGTGQALARVGDGLHRFERRAVARSASAVRGFWSGGGDRSRAGDARAPRIERALHGGEDYELLFTGTKAPKGVTRIGRVVRGRAGEIQFQGRPLERRGYDHFS